MLSPLRAAALKPALDGLYESYEQTDLADPVHFVRRFDRPADREIAGFLAAGFAFGNVTSILQSLEALFGLMGRRPADYVRRFSARRDGPALAPFVHRWTRGADVVALMLVLQAMLRRSGSIEGFFAEGDDPGAPNVAPGLESFSTRASEIDVTAAYGAIVPRVGVRYFFARPSRGGACKRLNLFLRWMVRRDRIDPGGWRAPTPARLVVPLDTHVIRVGRCLGLTRYRAPGWRMAEEITASLSRLDPADPTKYDFALCHLGMQDRCGFQRSARDARCPLRGLCRPGARTRRRSRAPSARR
jgi:uncharacterized protein (TIGR02757 family)